MNTKEIIKAFKLAEKHYGRPKWLCEIIGWNNTKTSISGLCYYFENTQKISGDVVNDKLKPLWIKYQTKFHDAWHFNNRNERLQAIRMVIRDLEESLVEEDWFKGDRLAGK